jgi:hypothetical protein
MILFAPFFIWFAKNKSSYLINLFFVLMGSKTFVGYEDEQLPSLKPCLLDVFPSIEKFNIPNDNKEHLNWIYAKNYDAWQDIQLIWEKCRWI